MPKSRSIFTRLTGETLPKTKGEINEFIRNFQDKHGRFPIPTKEEVDNATAELYDVKENRYAGRRTSEEKAKDERLKSLKEHMARVDAQTTPEVDKPKGGKKKGK